MKKIFLFLISILFLTGCTVFGTATSPTRAIETFFGKYQALDKDVVAQLESVVSTQDIAIAEQDRYKDLMKKQYQNLTYTIKDNTIDGDSAIVTTEIEVYDFNKKQADIDSYVNTHKSDFTDTTGAISNEKYTTYKLDELEKVNDRVKYTLDLKLTKIDDKWIMDTLTDTDMQKIHGVYSNI